MMNCEIKSVLWQIMKTERTQPEHAEAEGKTCHTSTILNFCNLRQCTVDFVFDVSFVWLPWKQGCSQLRCAPHQ